MITTASAGAPSAGAPSAGAPSAGGGQGEGQGGVGAVVGRGLDRGPAHHVVLVAGRLGVERLEVARAAEPHAVDRAEALEVAEVARAVAGGSDLDVAVPGERARQVGDLALHAVRVGVARADRERAAPGVGAEGEVELPLGERAVRAGPAVALVQRVR